jgi:hypothetical protein
MGEAAPVKAVPAISVSRRVSLGESAMCRVRIPLDNCTRRTWAMPDTLARCILLETVRVAEGLPVSARIPAIKQMVWWSSARLEWLLQILEERARQLEIRGFESFREALVHESQRIPGLITLSVFAEQAG